MANANADRNYFGINTKLEFRGDNYSLSLVESDTLRLHKQNFPATLSLDIKYDKEIFQDLRNGTFSLIFKDVRWLHHNKEISSYMKDNDNIINLSVSEFSKEGLDSLVIQTESWGGVIGNHPIYISINDDFGNFDSFLYPILNRLDSNNKVFTIVAVAMITLSCSDTLNYIEDGKIYKDQLNAIIPNTFTIIE